MKSLELIPEGFALVDDEDFEWAKAYRWYALWNASTKSFYATRHYRLHGKRYTVYLHREILGLGKGDKGRGDHRDHDTLNDTRENLRVATPSQNCCNRRMRADNSSGIKGVSWDKKRSKWLAQISYEGKRYFCGYHETSGLASEAVSNKRARLHGEFSWA